MNFDEVMELHRVVSAFCSENLDVPTKLGVYDIQSRDLGYILFIKTSSNSGEFRDFLKSVIQARKLELGRFRGNLVIHSSGIWSLLEN
jgi:hypothetical protein